MSSSETLVTPVADSRDHERWWNREEPRRRRTIGFVSIAAAAIMYPALAGATTVAIYVSGWITDAGAFAIGALIGAAVTLALSFALRRYAVADGANPSAYGHLSAALATIDAGLASYCPARRQSGEPAAACREASDQRDFAASELGLADDGRPPTAGMRWLLATGYTNLWLRLHRAEEALLEVVPETVLIREALYDDLRLQGSTIPNADGLLSRLRLAAEDLGPVAARYVGRQPGRPPSEKASSDEAARAVLREIRRSINDFRDDCREGLVRGRNRLYAAVLLTGLTTYGLLGLAVASNATRDEVVAGTAFYLVGGIVGLFNQLRSASAADTITEEDYGLSLARLLHTPLFSGLAAVGGVVVTSLTVAVIPTGANDRADQLPTLWQIFDLTENRAGLVVAAVFGLAPSLLISRLHGQVEKYKTDLKSSEAAQRSKTDGAR